MTSGRVAPSITHLRVHSHYTLMSSTASIDDLVSRACADGMQSLALTDQDALYGVVAFNRACTEAGIQPILGMTIAVCPPDEAPEPMSRPGRMVLLARGPSGYRSLCQLSSIVLGDPRRQIQPNRCLSWKELKTHHAGLVCLTGGRSGWIERYLREGKTEAAQRFLARVSGLFGDNCYLSLEIHQPQDQVIASEVVALGQRFGVAAVAVQPVYCIHQQDRPTLQLLAAIHRNCLFDAVPDSALPGDGNPAIDVHWLSPAEMEARFTAFPQALNAMGEVVGRCEPALPGGNPIWPAIDLPEGQSTDDLLRHKAMAGLRDKFGPELDEEIIGRLDGELEEIARCGYAPLFLVVADIVRFAREAEIPVNTRGSVANSLVAFCVGITTVDPIRHDLLFERFLNPARVDLPDIDLDLCSRRRDEVLDYVRRTYGADRVALVATVSRMQLRSAVHETAKACGFDEKSIKTLISRLPRRWHPDPRRRERRTVDELLAELESESERMVVRSGSCIVGQPRHLSVHPGGVVIAPGPLTDVVPVQWAPKGFLTTQYDHDDVEAIGLPKIDLLGIRALTVLADAVDLIRHHYDQTFRLEEVPPEDPKTAEILSRGETIGVFQCESEGAQRTLRQLKAKTVQDLAVANAFFKPGPATGGMARAFVRRYRGEETVSFLHPALEPILGRTKGVLIFQEQILRLAREIAGLTWKDADHLRRGMSKFQADEMEAMHAKFVSGCQRSQPNGPGFTSQQAERLWEQVVAFAGYGFNQGHATAYADVSYRMAYLKTHWPAAFLCARLADRGGYHHPAIYMAEAVRLGIRVHPPHVNYSGSAFSLSQVLEKEGSEKSVLWMGLGQVRDLRRRCVQEIIQERKRAPFIDLRDFMGRVHLQAKERRHLIQCGALDGLVESRAAALAEAENIAQAGSMYQRSFSFAEDAVPPETQVKRIEWEGRLLGMPVSVHPVQLVADALVEATPLHQLPEFPNRSLVVIGARLPGWTGGDGYFLGDGKAFVNVKMVEGGGAARAKPAIWQPVRILGRWRVDEWGGGWFQAERTEELA